MNPASNLCDDDNSRTIKHASCSSSSSSLEQAIENMMLFSSSQEQVMCFHPIHYHSFQAVTGFFPLSLQLQSRTCIACGQPLLSSSSSLVLLPFSSSNNQLPHQQSIVKCVACGKYAHRSCGLSSDATVWNDVCPVNAVKVAEFCSQQQAVTNGMIFDDKQAKTASLDVTSQQSPTRPISETSESTDPTKINTALQEHGTEVPVHHSTVAKSIPLSSNSLFSIFTKRRGVAVKDIDTSQNADVVDGTMTSSSTKERNEPNVVVTASENSCGTEYDHHHHPSSSALPRRPEEPQSKLLPNVEQQQTTEPRATTRPFFPLLLPPSKFFPGLSSKSTSHTIEEGNNYPAKDEGPTKFEKEKGSVLLASPKCLDDVDDDDDDDQHPNRNNSGIDGNVHRNPWSYFQNDKARNNNHHDSTLPISVVETNTVQASQPTRGSGTDSCSDGANSLQSNKTELDRVCIAERCSPKRSFPLSPSHLLASLPSAPCARKFNEGGFMNRTNGSPTAPVEMEINGRGQSASNASSSQPRLEDKQPDDTVHSEINKRTGSTPPTPTTRTTFPFLSAVSLLSSYPRHNNEHELQCHDDVTPTSSSEAISNIIIGTNDHPSPKSCAKIPEMQSDQMTIDTSNKTNIPQSNGTVGLEKSHLFSDPEQGKHGQDHDEMNLLSETLLSKDVEAIGESTKQEMERSPDVKGENDVNGSPSQSSRDRQDTITVSEILQDNEAVDSRNDYNNDNDLSEKKKQGDDDHDDQSVSNKNLSPLHFASHPFASVSKVLQENIIASFSKRLIIDSRGNRGPEQDRSPERANQAGLNNSPARHDSIRTPTDDVAADDINVQNAASFDSDAAASETEVQGLLEEVQPQVSAEDKVAAHKLLGLAVVAGGIAGGVAGLVFAGPVGGIVGVKFGQTAGILGVILEGSVSIGVLAGGVAVGMNTGQQIQEKWEEKRVLALGGGKDGTHQQILLVRPNIQTDPVWKEIYAKARQTYNESKRGISFSVLPNEAKLAKKERYEREADIVKTDEDEIPTADKIFLLVSRILNDKLSLPGHVYRFLLGAFRDRCDERGSLESIYANVKATSDDCDNEKENGKQLAGGDNENVLSHEVSSGLELTAHRARRQDAHAVIKYVTATLLEVRPGFAASPTITELTATAVEGLVFGEVYDLVIEEIEAEYFDKDNELLEKIAQFEREQAKLEHQAETENYKTLISEAALESLHHLPEAHSAVDKLRYCVDFLERISEHFSSSVKSASALGADSLLKMVCQHILVAKVFAINAQVAFLEEFARDEQLLRGREGYSLVTLQASLHFLNLSQDFALDIFGPLEDS